MMPNNCLALLIGAVLVLYAGPSTPLQAQSDDVSLSVMILDQQRADGIMRLWLQIGNGASVSRVFCRSSWSYTWISGEANGPGFAESKASIHGCGDDDHDPFWLLLPGEHRLDSFEATAPPKGNYDLQVEVELVEQTLGSSAITKRTLSWSGTASEALASGESLKARRPVK